MPRRIALSTGPFGQDRVKYLTKDIPFVELSNHKAEDLARIEQRIRDQGIQVISIHGPAPQDCRIYHPNIGADPQHFEEAYRLTQASFETAVRVGAPSVTLHAFYDLGGRLQLPHEDEEKFAFLRTLDAFADDLPAYVQSTSYLQARDHAIRNLQEIMRRLDESFPAEIDLCLENLNPRITYGLQVPSEFIVLAEAVGSPRLKLDLDVPHMYLSQHAHQFSLDEHVRSLDGHVGLISISQNHGGMYGVDRRYGEDEARPGLLDVDPHFPMFGAVRKVANAGEEKEGIENRAFRDVLAGAVMYDPDGSLPVGTVPYDDVLRLLPDVDVVVESDNRYAPMEDVVAQYLRFERMYGD